jgi:hypothetical protein
MNKSKALLKSIMIIAIVSLFWGCGSFERVDRIMKGAGCGFASVSGKLTISRIDSEATNTTKKLRYIYENTSDGVVKPMLAVIVFDAEGNTLGEQTVYFNNINPGRKQEVEEFLYAKNLVKRAKVLEAVDVNRCGYSSSKDCGRICGVYGRESTW